MLNFYAQKNTILRYLISLSVLLHLVGNIWHGDAHTILEINLPDIKMVFVFLVILISPILGALVVWTRYQSSGYWIVSISLAASVLFSL